MKKILLIAILTAAVVYAGSRIYIQNIKQQAQVSTAGVAITNGQLLTTSVAAGGTITFKLSVSGNQQLTTDQLAKLYIEPIGPNKPIMTITRTGTDTYSAQVPADFPVGTYEIAVFARLNSGTDMNWYFNETLIVTAAPVTVPSVVVPPVVTAPTTRNNITDVVIEATDHNAVIKFRVQNAVAQTKIKYKDTVSGVYQTSANTRKDPNQNNVYVAYVDGLTANTGYKFNIELIEFGPTNNVTTHPVEYSFNTTAKFTDSNLYKQQAERLKTFTVSATPVNQTSNPGLYNITWNNAAVDVCIYVDPKSILKVYMAKDEKKCFGGSTGSTQIQFLQNPENGVTKNSSVKFDLRIRPSISAGSGNFTPPAGFEYAPFSGNYRENTLIFDNSITRSIKDIQLPAVGPKLLSVDKTNVKPGDIVTIKVNDFVELDSSSQEILLTTNVSKFYDLYASGYYSARAPISSIDKVAKTISFRIPEIMAYTYKNKYNIATSRPEFYAGDYYVLLKNRGTLNPSAIKIRITK